jgi:hypothetical protein
VPRLHRWGKKLRLVLLELLVVLAIASFVYNAATANSVKPATSLYRGPFVRVDGKMVAYRRWGTHGTPIILLGGFVVPSFVWNGVGELLRRNHRVFSFCKGRRHTATPSRPRSASAQAVLSSPLASCRD